MTRGVSRFFTDYFPPETSGNASGVSLYGSAVSGTIGESKIETIVPSRSSPVKLRPIEVDSVQSSSSETTSPRRTSRRIFLARIPSHVTEDEMRKYFEAFGEVEDAYRPRDFNKTTFRGIGFITFVDIASTEKVVRMKHKLGGVEVVVDRAAPKTTILTAHKTSTGNLEAVSPPDSQGDNHQSTLDWLQIPDDLRQEDTNTVQQLKSSSGSYATSTGTNRAPSSHLSDDLNDISQGSGCESNGGGVRNSPRFRIMKSGRNLKDSGSDNLSHVRKVRGGPRIFVGKLAKETIEQDLADYFSTFGFVMDVYIPRSKENKAEHRGFGFVTFETEASIMRTISHGTHTLKGAVLAIDVAVPEESRSS